MAWNEGLGDEAIMLQIFMGLAVTLGTLVFGCLLVTRSKQCMVSSQYLLQTTLLGIGQYPNIVSHCIGDIIVTLYHIGVSGVTGYSGLHQITAREN